ncbi:RNA ligase 1 isoform X2 [Melanerpes formicivorus]|uniref:RNA ligase 1 isoform X2 n=1 Tax=Melanerpes formicivorus TaxID=211600 RepID=UPI00358E80DE
MSRRGAVQRKLPCLFVTEVKEEPSAKRERQPFKVLATETLSGKALEADLGSATPTEKVDGTCCYVTAYKGRPCLWARLDRRPCKQAERRFRSALCALDSCREFTWNVAEDFKPVPDSWIPAKDIEFSNGSPLPDENGHMPGWVPVEQHSKQHCWHCSAISYQAELALVLRHHPEPGLLEISPVPLAELLEQTLELIGTNINSNPYGLGSKKQPIHLLVPHGAFEIQNPPALKHKAILSWFEGCSEGKVEGIVWHCQDGSLIKLHRHHLGLRWPLAEPRLSSQPVLISFHTPQHHLHLEPKSLFHHFAKLDGHRFDRLQDIKFDA